MYTVSNGVLNIALALLFVVIFKFGAFGKLFSALLCNVIVFIIMVWQFRRNLIIRTSISEFKPIFLFCLPLAASAMLGYFTHGFATTYLESVSDITEYGIYVVGYSIGCYLTVFSTAINSTFQPDIYESIIKRQRGRFIKYATLQIAMIGIVVAVFVILAPFIISILTAGRYDASTPYAQIVAWSTLTSGIYYIVNNVTIATDHPRLYLYTTILGSVCIVAVMPVAVRHYSYAGGAWVMVLSYVAFTLINLLLLYLDRWYKFSK